MSMRLSDCSKYPYAQLPAERVGDDLEALIDGTISHDECADRGQARADTAADGD